MKPLRISEEPWSLPKKKLTKTAKEGIKVTEAIDVHDLPEKEVRLVKELVELLRERRKEAKEETEAGEEITFAEWPLGVKGELTREEIYDYL